jgi:hypothetical protein
MLDFSLKRQLDSHMDIAIRKIIQTLFFFNVVMASTKEVLLYTLNVITLVQTITDNNNQMIAIIK